MKALMKLIFYFKSENSAHKSILLKNAGKVEITVHQHYYFYILLAILSVFYYY